MKKQLLITALIVSGLCAKSITINNLSSGAVGAKALLPTYYSSDGTDLSYSDDWGSINPNSTRTISLEDITTKYSDGSIVIKQYSKIKSVNLAWQTDCKKTTVSCNGNPPNECSRACEPDPRHPNPNQSCTYAKCDNHSKNIKIGDASMTVTISKDNQVSIK